MHSYMCTHTYTYNHMPMSAVNSVANKLIPLTLTVPGRDICH